MIKSCYGKYLLLSFTICFFLYIGLGLVVENVNSDIVCWQIFTIFSFFLFLYIGLRVKVRQMFLLIFSFQLFLSYILHYYFFNYTDNIFGYNAVDSLLYSRIALNIKDLSFIESIRAIRLYLDDLSDLGFPLFLKYVYEIGGNLVNSVRLLILLNCIMQMVTCIITYNLAERILHDSKKSRWITLLWGLNTASVYLNVSGLKEPLFLLLCTATMWAIYKCHDKKIIGWHLIVLVLIASTWLFRYYISLFLIIIYLGYCWFPYLYKHLFGIISVLSIIVCIYFTSVLVTYFPEIYYALLNTEEAFSSGLAFKYASYLLAFLSPIPKFFQMTTPQDLIMIVYSIIKFSFSIFALVGSYYYIKKKQIQFYPLISIVLFNVLLLIVSGHMIEYRYSYVVMPSFFILMIAGMEYKNKYITAGYLIFSVLIIVMFNLRMY